MVAMADEYQQLPQNDDNDESVLEYFEHNEQALERILVGDMTDAVIRDIVALCYDPVSPYNGWKKYVNNMDIENPIIINNIELAAISSREPHLYILLDGFMRLQSINRIIGCMRRSRRIDVLRYLRNYITKRGILSEIPQNHDSNSASSEAYKSENGAVNHVSIEKQCYDEKCETSEFLEIPEELNDICDPAEIKPKVFIPHAEFDTSIAEDLSAELTRQGIIAKTFNKVKDYANADTLDEVFQKVDFVVPVLSDNFMKEIDPANHAEYLSSIYVKHNRRMKDLILDEYNRCETHSCILRVRPVIVKEFNRKSVKEMGEKLPGKPAFPRAFQLPNEFEKFVKMLKGNKESRIKNIQ